MPSALNASDSADVFGMSTIGTYRSETRRKTWSDLSPGATHATKSPDCETAMGVRGRGVDTEATMVVIPAESVRIIPDSLVLMLDPSGSVTENLFFNSDSASVMLWSVSILPSPASTAT